jgi:hypothetical protein
MAQPRAIARNPFQKSCEGFLPRKKADTKATGTKDHQMGMKILAISPRMKTRGKSIVYFFNVNVDII